MDRSGRIGPSVQRGDLGNTAYIPPSQPPPAFPLGPREVARECALTSPNTYMIREGSQFTSMIPRAICPPWSCRRRNENRFITLRRIDIIDGIHLAQHRAAAAAAVATTGLASESRNRKVPLLHGAWPIAHPTSRIQIRTLTKLRQKRVAGGLCWGQHVG